jgi:hypothetical protein
MFAIGLQLYSKTRGDSRKYVSPPRYTAENIVRYVLLKRVIVPDINPSGCFGLIFGNPDVEDAVAAFRRNSLGISVFRQGEGTVESTVAALHDVNTPLFPVRFCADFPL